MPLGSYQVNFSRQYHPNYTLIITLFFLGLVVCLMIYSQLFKNDPCGGLEQRSCPALYVCRMDPNLPYDEGYCEPNTIPLLTFGIVKRIF